MACLGYHKKRLQIAINKWYQAYCAKALVMEIVQEQTGWVHLYMIQTIKDIYLSHMHWKTFIILMAILSEPAKKCDTNII